MTAQTAQTPMDTNTHGHKLPLSVLVLIYNELGQILLLHRADRAGFWQSVTGSLEAGEAPAQAAWREVREETGLQMETKDLYDWHYSSEYEIYPHWRHRYAPGVSHNTEHVFSLCVSSDSPIVIAEREHTQWGWFTRQAAANKVFSPSNRAAILALPQRCPSWPPKHTPKG